MAKHKGALSIEQIYRNRYIYAQYEILRMQRSYRSIDAISRYIALHCSMPHHYMSDQACKVVYANFFRNGKINATGAKRVLIESFLKCCQSIKTHHGIETASAICELANDMPCPTTGLTHYQIARILRSMGAH